MRINRFEDIEAWKTARELVRELYETFEGCRDTGFKDQIQRAGISIMSNIAEGFERKTNKELINFLAIARGSNAEVTSMLYAAIDIGFLDHPSFEKLMGRANRVSGLLNGFISYLKTTTKKK